MSHLPAFPRRRDSRRPVRRLDRHDARLPPLAVPTGAIRRRHVATVHGADGVAIARARRDVYVLLETWSSEDGWVAPAPGVAGVPLVLSELVTHAVRHERATRVDVEVVDQRDSVTVVVEFTRAPGVTPDEVPGHVGLTVVGDLAARWGRADTASGGRLWAEIATPRALAS